VFLWLLLDIEYGAMIGLKIIQETTDWGSHKIPNHTYAVIQNRTKLVAFKPANSDEIKTFKKHLSFSTTRRKFVEVKDKDIIKQFMDKL
jgi:hypothetical protein